MTSSLSLFDLAARTTRTLDSRLRASRSSWHPTRRILQETLAEMIGTTRSRVNFFMNKFRKLGYIEYSGDSDIKIHDSLLAIVLHD